MKKITALLLALVLMFSFAACGGEKKKEDSSEKELVNITPSGNSTQLFDFREDEMTFKEQVVFDNENYLVKVTGINPQYYGYALNVYFENKSASNSYTFMTLDSSIDGVDATVSGAPDLAPGQKTTKEISFPSENLIENGVTAFSDIELVFSVYENFDDFSDKPIEEKKVNVYPYGEDKAVKFERKPQSTDKVIVDNENVTAIITSYEKNDSYAYEVDIFLINKTNEQIKFQADDVTVNGYLINPGYFTYISAGKCKFTSMYWYEDKFEMNNISAVDEISFNLRAFAGSSVSGTEYANVNYTLNP